MKQALLFFTGILLTFLVKAQEYPHPMPAYQPTPENLKSREEFEDMKFGMFIHWGIYSTLADGEWVMHTKKIPYSNYKRVADFFYPQQFNAKEWVALAKAAGMKYITITSRHHDGFSMFKTAASPYNIVEGSPYGKDPLKELSDECKREGIRLHFYYSLLDWGRPDYGFDKAIVNSAPENTNWESYISFMKAQLKELLTNYSSIGGIWFDGHWQRPTANWHYDEIYNLIHQLSPKTLIGNNHHISTIPGEDFQMFEKDLPGENKSGYSEGSAVGSLPLETCETMNNSWGFNINDTKYKTVKQLVHYMVNAAGRNANFLLNVGPMPNGKIQPEFTDTLKSVGIWMKKYGKSIYGTKGNVIAPQDWGVITAKDKRIFVHVLKIPGQNYLFVPGLNKKILAAHNMDDRSALKFKQQAKGLFIYFKEMPTDVIDYIIELKTE